ncbi:MAG TPA: sigma-70 family RNA polymerase sigma factor [Anaeromyxobacteraceae bacterium]|nr:sigma-70 family RNA polymerase sigma factor [Anaeromyxobacteraceae bacterium]
MRAMSVEEQVAALLAAQDYGRAAETVMREYGPGVRGLLLTLFRRNRDAGEEAFSLFAENLWRYIPKFRGDSSVRTWVYCVARSAAVSVTREGWRRNALRLETRDAEALAEEVRTRSAVRLERQSAELLSLRDELDLDEQTLLTLRLDERLPWEEIAQIMSSEGETLEAAAWRKRFERLKTRLGELARAKGLIE